MHRSLTHPCTPVIRSMTLSMRSHFDIPFCSIHHNYHRFDVVRIDLSDASFPASEMLIFFPHSFHLLLPVPSELKLIDKARMAMLTFNRMERERTVENLLNEMISFASSFSRSLFISVSRRRRSCGHSF